MRTQQPTTGPPMPQAALGVTCGTAGGGAGPRQVIHRYSHPLLLHLEGKGSPKGWGGRIPKALCLPAVLSQRDAAPQGTFLAVTTWECI